MNEPKETDLCRRCDHPWSDHDDDVALRWKVECECCRGGEFIGEPAPLDDLLPEASS